MGMQITASAMSTDRTAAMKQNREAFSSMMSAATSGDLETAKSAYAKLTADRKPPADSPLAALGTAIESGDATAVKTAADTLQKARKGGHGRRGDGPPQISTVQPSKAIDSISTVQPTKAIDSISTVQPAKGIDSISTVQSAKLPDSIYTIDILA